MKGLFGFFRGKSKDAEKSVPAPPAQTPVTPPPAPPPPPARSSEPPPSAINEKLAKISSIQLEEEILEDVEEISLDSAPPAVTGDNLAIDARQVLVLFPEETLRAPLDELIEKYGSSSFSFSFSRSEVMYGLSLGRLEFTVGDLVSKFAHNVFSQTIQNHFNDRISIPLKYVVPQVPPAWLSVRADQNRSREKVLTQMEDLFTGLSVGGSAATPRSSVHAPEPPSEPGHEPEALTVDQPPERLAPPSRVAVSSPEAKGAPSRERKADTVYVPADLILEAMPESVLVAPIDELKEQYGDDPEFEFAFSKEVILFGLAGGRMGFTVQALADMFPYDVFQNLDEQGSTDVILPLSRIVPRVPTQWFSRPNQDASLEQKIKGMDDIFTGFGAPSRVEEPANEHQKAMLSSVTIPRSASQVDEPEAEEPDDDVDVDVPEDHVEDEPVVPSAPAPVVAAFRAPEPVSAQPVNVETPSEPVDEEPDAVQPAARLTDEDDARGNRRTLKIQRPPGGDTPMDMPPAPSWGAGQPVLKLKRTGSALPLKSKTLLPGEAPAEEEVGTKSTPGQPVVKLKRKTEASFERPVRPEAPGVPAPPPAPAAATPGTGDGAPPASSAVAALMERLRKGQLGKQTEGHASAPATPSAPAAPAASAPAAPGTSDLAQRILQLGRRDKPAEPEVGSPAAPAAPADPASPTASDWSPATEVVRRPLIVTPTPLVAPVVPPVAPAPPAAPVAPAASLPMTPLLPPSAPPAAPPAPPTISRVEAPAEPVVAPVALPPATLAPTPIQPPTVEPESVLLEPEAKVEVDASAIAAAMATSHIGLTADEVEAIGAEVFGEAEAPPVPDAADIDDDVIDTYHSQAPNGIDINRCDEDELCRFAGVGVRTAKQIIQHRRANGPFRQIQDLLNVPGLGSHTYRNMTGLGSRASLRAAERRVNEALGIDDDNISLQALARVVVEQVQLGAFFITGTDGLVRVKHGVDPAAMKLADSLSAVAPQIFLRGHRTMAQAKLPDAEMFTFYMGKRAVTFAGTGEMFCVCIHDSQYPSPKHMKLCHKFSTELAWYFSFRAVV